MKSIQILLFVFSVVTAWSQAQANQQSLESNKKTVTSFYTMAFNEPSDP